MVITRVQDFITSHIKQHLHDGEPFGQVPVLVALPQQPTLEQSLLALLVQQVEALTSAVRGLHQQQSLVVGNYQWKPRLQLP